MNAIDENELTDVVREEIERSGNSVTCSQCNVKLQSAFCAPVGFVCQKCKIEISTTRLQENPTKQKWAKCNLLGQTYFIEGLGQLYLHSDEKVGVRLEQILGQDTMDAHRDKLDKLFEFAQQEQQRYYFSPIDFSLVRFERHFEPTPEIMDFWLTLFCVYDLRNYMCDLQ